MARREFSEPSALPSGRIPTLNQRGFTTAKPDKVTEAFIEFARTADGESLDIGCAYGVAVKRVLELGGRICASDMDKRHLEILESSVPIEHLGRLRCVQAMLPTSDFCTDSFGAILCARVLHFLDGSEVEASLRKMHRWLAPRGKIFIVVDSPYSGVSAPNVAPVYEYNKSCNVQWPGFMPDVQRFAPPSCNVTYATSFIHFMDPETISCACERAGFTIESAGYISRVVAREIADTQGRDHAYVIARKD